MEKINEIKKFLDIEELSKLEQGFVHGGVEEAKQKVKVKCNCSGCNHQVVVS